MADHSILSPSSAERWVHCPGSVTLSALYPEKPTPQSLEGDAAHWVLEQFCKAPATNLSPGDLDPAGTPIDQDMIDAARAALFQIGEEIGQVSLPDVVSEMKVDIPEISEHCFGTVDLHWYDQKNNKLYLWDYKYGHKTIRAWENWQLISYASGLISHYGVNDPETRVLIRIKQPRDFNGRPDEKRWDTSVGDLRAYVNKLSNSAGLALSPSSKTISGKQCLYCPARHACSSSREASMEAFRFTFSPQVQDVDPTQQGMELTLLKKASTALEARITGLESQVENSLRAGKSVPGFRLEDRTGNRKWIIDDNAQMIQVLEILTGIDCREEEKPKTPAKVEKLLKENNVDESVIHGYTTRPNSGVKLVEDDGSRARFIFNIKPVENSNV